MGSRKMGGAWVAGLLGVGAALVGAARAQDLGVKAPAQQEATAIVGATVHPVSGGALADGVVAFERGRLTFVGTREQWAREAKGDWRVIDGAGTHVYPGMIGAYSQMGLTEIQSVRPSNDLSETGGVTPEVLALTAVNPDSTLIPVTRTNGVLLTGVFPQGGSVPGRGSVVRLDGWTTEDMGVEVTRGGRASRAAGLAVSWPNVRVVRAWWNERSDEEQQKEIDQALLRMEQVFDAAAGYHARRTSDAGEPLDLRYEAMRPLFAENEGGMAVFVSAGDRDQIVSAVSFFAKRGIRMVLVGGRDAPDCAAVLKEAKVPVIVQGTFSFPKRADSAYDDAFTLPNRLLEAGVEFCIASGDDTAHERNLPYNAALAVAYGLPAEEGVRAITLSAARILGIADRYGSLEVGKSATLIMTSGNPLEVRANTLRAFIDGREIDLTNKQTALAEKYREKYRQMGAVEAGAR